MIETASEAFVDDYSVNPTSWDELEPDYIRTGAIDHSHWQIDFSTMQLTGAGPCEDR